MWWEHRRSDSSSSYEADNRILFPLTKIKGEAFKSIYIYNSRERATLFSRIILRYLTYYRFSEYK